MVRMEWENGYKWRNSFVICKQCVPWNISVSLAITLWGQVTPICVSKLTIIGSDNDLSPGRRQAIIWTNARILLIGPPGTNLNEMLIKIHTFLFKNIHLKMSSGKWCPFYLGLNVSSDDYVLSICPSKVYLGMLIYQIELVAWYFHTIKIPTCVFKTALMWLGTDCI